MVLAAGPDASWTDAKALAILAWATLVSPGHTTLNPQAKLFDLLSDETLAQEVLKAEGPDPEEGGNRTLCLVGCSTLTIFISSMGWGWFLCPHKLRQACQGPC